MTTGYIKDGDTILFQGDSITDCGRVGAQDGLGSGYVSVVAGLMAARHPKLKVKIINRGNGGDRTVELINRWQADCLNLKPDVLSIKIGVNDVWRKAGEWNGQKHVPIEEYQANLTKLIDQAQAGGIKRMVLVSPTTIEPDNNGVLNKLLGAYDAFVKKTAKDRGFIYVDARSAIMKARTDRPEVVWTTDGCHPSVAGHAILAESWLKAVGM